MINNYEEIALAKFQDGFNCSQSVLFAFAEKFGLDEDIALRISGAFGAGMGRTQATCGVVTGAYMVIGLKYAHTRKEEDYRKEITYSKVREFAERFKAKCGTTICRELLDGCDLLTEEGHERFKNESFKDKICIPCMRESVRILNELLD